MIQHQQRGRSLLIQILLLPPPTTHPFLAQLRSTLRDLAQLLCRIHWLERGGTYPEMSGWRVVWRYMMQLWPESGRGLVGVEVGAVGGLATGGGGDGVVPAGCGACAGGEEGGRGGAGGGDLG